MKKQVISLVALASIALAGCATNTTDKNASAELNGAGELWNSYVGIQSDSTDYAAPFAADFD